MSSQHLHTIMDPNRFLSISPHHYGTKKIPLNISKPLWTQTDSSQHLHTIMDPNRFLSTSPHHYGPKQIPLNISTPLWTQTQLDTLNTHISNTHNKQQQPTDIIKVLQLKILTDIFKIFKTQKDQINILF